MSHRLSYEYRKHWDQLIDLYGRLCFYCRDEIATTIDHVVPYSYDTDNSIENLVPACALCNVLAGSKHFEDIEHKRQFILKRRHNRKLRHGICVDCYLPFSYRVHSPSLFLCAECYDLEYGTAKSKSAAWQRWLDELVSADILPDAHAVLRARRDMFRPQDRAGKAHSLADAYDRILRPCKEKP